MMKLYRDRALVRCAPSTYLTVLTLLAGVLNFLCGINIDIYSPSMPTLAEFFNVSASMMKNTITITLIGWTIGVLFFGVLSDSLGRKKILAFGLFFYTLVSFLAPFCHVMVLLMLVRFIQGLMVASVTIGCRALLIDSIKGRRFNIALLYTSIGFGLGPIIGPYIGGVLQTYVGWQANFVALGVVSLCLFVILMLFIDESIGHRHPLQLKNAFLRIKTLCQHKMFVIGGLILGIIQIEITLYPTVGPFIVEGILQKSVLTYSKTALLMGASYLSGTLTNRFLLHYFEPKRICDAACVVMLLSLALSILLSAFSHLNLVTLILPIFILCFSAGLVFGNVMAKNLQQFMQHAGIAIALQTMLLLLMSAIGTFIISHIHIEKLSQLTAIFWVLISFEVVILCYYRRMFNKSVST